MDSIIDRVNQKKEVQKLNKTTKRIQKARKNTKIAEKEAAEFEEIHKLLQDTDNSELVKSKPESPPKEKNSSESKILPTKEPEANVFHDDLIFLLFNEKTCRLKNFLKDKEKCFIFGKNDEIPTEECFRKLIAYHVNETTLSEEGSCSSVSLYVLYLMSVHQNQEFVAGCFDFLNSQKFQLQPMDIIPIFINFGAKEDNFVNFRGETIKSRFCYNENTQVLSGKIDFPFYNVEMVGRILLLYITEDLFLINSSIKPLISFFVRVILDPKIRSGCLLPLYSTILTLICVKAQSDFSLKEIIDLIYLKEEHLLNQLEICQRISKSISPELFEGLVVKILSGILRTEIFPKRSLKKINYLKSVLKKLQSRELSFLELYSLLQLVNSSLPGLTATVKDSTEINTLLACLEQKISKIEDSVDLIRIKLEIAKVGNQVTNCVKDRFTVDEAMTKSSSVKKVKCSN